MSTESTTLRVNDISVEVYRKKIKNLHVGVYPPDGHVRVAAPLRLDDEAVRLAIVTRLPWIKRRQAEFARQERQSAREMITGESHYFFGKRYLLDVIEAGSRKRVEIANNKTLRLTIRPGTDVPARRRLLDDWYRARLREEVDEIYPRWESVVGQEAVEYRIKRMKTLWGSCNAAAGRIWLNLELVKKPRECLEYILVHELVHLIERHHNDRFMELMDRFMPDWRSRRDELNRAPLANDDWDY
jgi:predicted metal-dependent hydrolase